MQREFWYQRWQLGEIGFHQGEINNHLKLFWSRLSIPSDSRVFVPLCGKSRDMLWLRDQGHSILGVELSPIAVRDFFRENRLEAEVRNIENFQRFKANNIEILCGDFFQLKPEHLEGVAAVYDRASLVALPLELRARYANHLQRIVTPPGSILLVTFDYDQREISGPPFAVAEDEVKLLFGARYKIETIYTEDLLSGEETERWRTRGLTKVEEKVILLTPRIAL